MIIGCIALINHRIIRREKSLYENALIRIKKRTQNVDNNAQYYLLVTIYYFGVL